ncbi:brix domain-containing protein [Toxoplasma gondii GT1]|uniref:Brix domain-containing protein n=2 Tax=Toxoplasma gondii TaxID=5811 RepID=S7UL49_TOXGG|nr:brix domain-containing protein [Toxoplasma gondii GT1]KAF4645614.1 brix domain-containing protein [Toxoplasma gondii]
MGAAGGEARKAPHGAKAKKLSAADSGVSTLCEDAKESGKGIVGSEPEKKDRRALKKTKRFDKQKPAAVTSPFAAPSPAPLAQTIEKRDVQKRTKSSAGRNRGGAALEKNRANNASKRSPQKIKEEEEEEEEVEEDEEKEEEEEEEEEKEEEEEEEEVEEEDEEEDEVMSCRPRNSSVGTTGGEGEGKDAEGRDAEGVSPAPADPYLLAEADYLRREKRWVNRQRVLVLGSRGVTHLQRHLMEDFKRLLPHHKAESKWERKQTMKDISELAQLRACNNVLYFESRKRDLLLHVSKIPHGPTLIFRVLNIHTLAEMKMTGNCLLHSRPLLLFSPEFGSEHGPAQPHLALIKEVFVQVFGTPRNHPKAKPFFDHALAFYKFDGNRIWFRHYQIAPLIGGEGGDADTPERQTFIEIGPRCVLEIVKILDGSFSGKTIWSNRNYICSRDLVALQRMGRAQSYAQRVQAKEKRTERLDKLHIEESPLAMENVFGDFVRDSEDRRGKKKRKVGEA